MQNIECIDMWVGFKNLKIWGFFYLCMFYFVKSAFLVNIKPLVWFEWGGGHYIVLTHLTCLAHSKHQGQQAFPHQDRLVHHWTVRGWVCRSSSGQSCLLSSVYWWKNMKPVTVLAEALEGIDLGETTHKKPGTTVPESIHSFSEWPAPHRPPLALPPHLALWLSEVLATTAVLLQDST